MAKMAAEQGVVTKKQRDAEEESQKNKTKSTKEIYEEKIKAAALHSCWVELQRCKLVKKLESHLHSLIR